MSLDTRDSYKQVYDKIQASQTYKDAKKSYDDQVKKVGDSLEEKKSQISETLNSAKEIGRAHV